MKAITDSKASEARASSTQMDSSTSSNLSIDMANDVDDAESITFDELRFLVDLPTISALDMDVIKLTAQFAARNGKQFILHLSQKESRNPQFDFLKPHHNLHQFYQTLMKQYVLMLNPSEPILNRVRKCAFNSADHLNVVKRRAQIEKLERKRIQEEESAHNAELEAFNKIDWHDFSVAETVMFGPEDQISDLATPLSPEIMKALPISHRMEMWSGGQDLGKEATLNSAGNESDEMEIDEPSDFIPAPLASSNNEVIMGAAFGSGASIKVRTDYVPRSGSTPSSATQICTICKASVPVSQIEEHIRIELLDPKWRTQRLAALAKTKDSNLVETGTDVSRNLDALSRFKSGAADHLTSSGPSRPIWDGRTDSIGQINRAAQIMSRPQIEKEMDDLQRSGDYSLDPNRGIGPRHQQAASPTAKKDQSKETSQHTK
jgi:splicing factor 3A subunit 1